MEESRLMSGRPSLLRNREICGFFPLKSVVVAAKSSWSAWQEKRWTLKHELLSKAWFRLEGGFGLWGDMEQSYTVCRILEGWQFPQPIQQLCASWAPVGRAPGVRTPRPCTRGYSSSVQWAWFASPALTRFPVLRQDRPLSPVLFVTYR